MSNIEILDFDTPSGKSSDSGSTGTHKNTSLKKLMKKKPFMIALVVIALVGLYVWYKSINSGSSESVAYTTSGYTGYPVVNSGSSYGETNTAFTTDTIYAMQEAFQSQLDNLQTIYDNSNEQLASQVIALNEKFNTTEDVVKSQASQIEIQNAISAMQYNSDRYHYATSDAEKKALHDANEAIASKYGWTFDNSDGYWYDADGYRVYQTATQSNFASGSKSSASQSTPSTSTTVKTASTGNSSLGGKTASSSTSSSSSSKAGNGGIRYTFLSGSEASKSLGANIEGNVRVEA